MKKDADYVFYELTRSICPRCRKVIDAKVLLRDNKVYMRKRCPDCGLFHRNTRALNLRDNLANSEQELCCCAYPDHLLEVCPLIQVVCGNNAKTR